MSKPAYPPSGHDIGADELSAELDADEVALLGRVRRLRREDSVPSAVRARLLARALNEVAHAEPDRVVPAGQWVALPPRGMGFALGWVAALAVGVLAFGQLRTWLGGFGDPSASHEPPESGATRPLGDRLFQSALFRAPAQALAGAWPGRDVNLFNERPFSPESRSWQVRQWADLTTEPGAAAPYEFVDGALCVGLGAGQRVIGGWPWLPRDAAAPGTASTSGSAPAPVQIRAGRSYRLAFKAWAREPLPTQVLIAVGHQRLPFSAVAGARVPVSSEPHPFVVNFVAAHDDPAIGVAFFAAGAAGSGTRVCLSDLNLSEGKPLSVNP